MVINLALSSFLSTFAPSVLIFWSRAFIKYHSACISLLPTFLASTQFVLCSPFVLPLPLVAVKRTEGCVFVIIASNYPVFQKWCSNYSESIMINGQADKMSCLHIGPHSSLQNICECKVHVYPVSNILYSSLTNCSPFISSVCPAGWQPGADTIKPDIKNSKEYFSKQK